jgi:endonuclease/exonuclease/phosphatase family metal-dependent hydrolase
LIRELKTVTYNLWGRSMPATYWREREEVRGALPGSKTIEITDEMTIWEARRAQLERVLGEAAPALVAFQEVTGSPGAGRSRAEELARAVGLPHVAQEGPLAVASRHPLRSARTRPLPVPAGAYGGCPYLLEADLGFATVWVVHLPVGPDSIKVACARMLLDAAAEPAGPLVICGDLNWPADGEAMRHLLHDGTLVDGWIAGGGHRAALTQPLPDRRWRLDYVLMRSRDDIAVRPDARILGDRPDENGLFPSDHCGMSVTLCIPGVPDVSDVPSADRA